MSRRLAAIPGIGPITALSVALRVAAMQFASARHFAAWLGLVPRQCSTAGKSRLGGIRLGGIRLGGISRAGDERLRQLLVLGATAVIRHAKPGRPATSAWLLNLLSRTPRKLAAVALANKMARVVWPVWCGPCGVARVVWPVWCGPCGVGHDDERGGLPASAGGHLTARLPRV